MKPPGKLNLDFVNQRMSRPSTYRKARDLPRLVVSSRHLTPEDAELLAASGWDGFHKVVDERDGYTLSCTGIWTDQDPAAFEAKLARLLELGHSGGFIEAMRMARAQDAWSFRFDNYAETIDDLPLGGYEPGVQPGR